MRLYWASNEVEFGDGEWVALSNDGWRPVKPLLWW